MRRAHTIQREIQKEAVEVGIVDAPTSEDQRNVAIQPFGGASFLKRTVRAGGRMFEVVRFAITDAGRRSLESRA